MKTTFPSSKAKLLFEGINDIDFTVNTVLKHKKFVIEANKFLSKEINRDLTAVFMGCHMAYPQRTMKARVMHLIEKMGRVGL